MVNGATPLVSIVTLNYNQTEITCQFLESTRQLSYSNYEILVCDMASQVDPTKEITSLNVPRVRVLVSDRNLGFAGGNNWGMRRARGDFFLIINNDTEVTTALLQQLLNPFFLYPDVGATSPKILFYDKPGTLQYAGFNAMNYFTGRTSTIGEGEHDSGQYDIAGKTNAAHGCAMMIKREVLERVGMLPEKFFLYYEEWDLSARIIKAGLTIWFVPEAIVYHKASSTVGKLNPLKTYYLTRNRILFLRRNTDYFHLLVFWPFFIFFSIPKSVYRYLRNNQPRQLAAFFKGAYWNLLHSSSSEL